MPNDLPLPNDLQHLLEKRDGVERRSASETDVDGSSDAVEPSKTDDTPERRKSIRRNEDRNTK